MATSVFDPTEEFVGNGLVSDYTFDFRITSLAHLIILSFTAAGVLNFKVDGNDATYLTTVDFDPIAGGGTVHLVDPLANTDHLVLLLANDEPLQESEFRDKRDFTLRRIEAALDVQNGAIQRLAWLAKRSLRVSDQVLNAVGFDGEMPDMAVDSILAFNPAGDGFYAAMTVPDLNANVAAAEASEDAAAASEANAGASEANAEASEDAAATSETNAATSASGAATSATAAASSASSASTSATSATASATSATSSKNAAATSATAAAASQVAAAASETNAATSASAASASQTAAATSATLAGTRATNALNSQTAAATSASNASTSESNAATSAAAAAQSAIDAAAAASSSPTSFGTRTVPKSIAAATGINAAAANMSITAMDQIIFVKGNILGDNDLSGLGTQIQAHTVVGARMSIVGVDNTHPIILGDGNGLMIRGNWRSDDDNLIQLFYDGAVWREESRAA